MEPYSQRDATTVDWQGNVECGHVEQDMAVGNINLSNIGSGTKTLNLWREGHVVHASMIVTARLGRQTRLSRAAPSPRDSARSLTSFSLARASRTTRYPATTGGGWPRWAS